jgi:hypothetical protein
MPINLKCARMCCRPVVACLCDLTVTLSGQSAEYWSGNWAAVTEGNPIPHWLLTQHPLALCGGIAVWIAVFCTAIFRLSPRPVRTVAIVVMLGHATAASTWLLNMKPWGILYACGLLAFLKLIDWSICQRGYTASENLAGSESPARS